jgi:inactivated superfamily I helicase
MNTEQITTKQIKALLKEAIAAGDQKQVRICERALDGWVSAIAECTRIIQAAKANAGR